MPIQSDLYIDASKFRPESVREQTEKANAIVEHLTTSSPRWNEVGVAKYRAMRDAGEYGMPKPVFLENALDGTIPSREAGRDIPVRIYKPDNGKPSKGVILHIHGGGFVLFSHKHCDATLQMYANECQLTAVSVGYRLAPEDPYPAGLQDCYVAAEYLADHARKEYGAPLRFICGESAGGCLTVQTAFHLIRSRPSHKLDGLVLLYGEFDLALGLPMLSTQTRPLVITHESLERFNKAYLPDMSPAERRSPHISPLYEDMVALARSSPAGLLPPALFICGTADPLLDDTLLMGTKWMITGAEAVVKLYPGASHSFTSFPGLAIADEATEVTIQFVNEKLDAAV